MKYKYRKVLPFFHFILEQNVIKEVEVVNLGNVGMNVHYNIISPQKRFVIVGLENENFFIPAQSSFKIDVCFITTDFDNELIRAKLIFNVSSFILVVTNLSNSLSRKLV